MTFPKVSTFDFLEGKIVKLWLLEIDNEILRRYGII